MPCHGEWIKCRPEMIHGKPRRLYIVSDMEGLGREQNCYEAKFSILKNKGFTMLARERNKRFSKIMKNFADPLIIYSKWNGYLEGKCADEFSRIKAFATYHSRVRVVQNGEVYFF